MKVFLSVDEDGKAWNRGFGPHSEIFYDKAVNEAKRILAETESQVQHVNVKLLKGTCGSILTESLRSWIQA